MDNESQAVDCDDRLLNTNTKPILSFSIRSNLQINPTSDHKVYIYIIAATYMRLTTSIPISMKHPH